MHNTANEVLSIVKDSECHEGWRKNELQIYAQTIALCNLFPLCEDRVKGKN
jgi:hypothetical protein